MKFVIRQANHLTNTFMEHFNTSTEHFPDYDSNINNIIRINTSSDADEDETEDYDFDYDPNEMYYALNGK